jgi:Zn finger protein HypA/HybF involved in hydrogenase expression
MHELGIAESVLEIVRAEVARHPGTRPAKVALRIGELAAVEPSSLEFCSKPWCAKPISKR